MCDINKILSKFNLTLNKNLLCLVNKTKKFDEKYTKNDKFKLIILNTKYIIKNKTIDCEK